MSCCTLPLIAGPVFLDRHAVRMSFEERFSQFQWVRSALEAGPGELEFRWYEQLHSLCMLNCIGNGEHAVTLMRLGSFVNHGSGEACNADIVGLGGSAGRNMIRFCARQPIEAGEEICISYYGHTTDDEARARILNQFMIKEPLEGACPPCY